jgi:hypothetical protein
MSNGNTEKKQLARTTPPTVDGFDGFTNEVEGVDADGHGAPAGVIKGLLIRFTNEATYELRDGYEMPKVELIVVDVLRVLQKWKDRSLVGKPRILEPGEKVPDIVALNNECLKSEWGTDFDGKPKGPWQFQYVVYLFDPATMDRYTFPTGTVGGGIAVRGIVEKIKWMRKFRGARVYPVIELADVFMNTKFGGRQRPHFVVKRWVQLGDDKLALAAPQPNATPGIEITAEPINDAALPGMMKTVNEPTLAEQMGDEVLWNDGPDINVPVDKSDKSVLGSHLKKSVEPQKLPINKRGVQKITGGRSR